ncbi:MAG: dihydropteroate synthase [Bacteroidaceae bacterium]|nr:dihydropteroate synthase [Bacteroidaceae bacterium]
MQTVHETLPYSINVGGDLLSLEVPIVMGILNATPDSFYQHHEGAEAIRLRTRQIIEEGATIVDVGACSTRPGFVPPDEMEEMRRLREALKVVREESPKAIVSVDTFRADVAKMCVDEFGVQMVNDISEGNLDKEMFKTIAELGVPYVLTHNPSNPYRSGESEESEKFLSRFMQDMGNKVEKLHELGVCDVILDPGFGFGKTLEENYILMQNLEVLHELHLPLLVGVSHKSMIYKLLGTTPDEAQNGSTVLHTVALQKGAHILRAHEVREAKECIKICQMLKNSK